MKFKTLGQTNRAVEISLHQGDQIFTNPEVLFYISDNIKTEYVSKEENVFKNILSFVAGDSSKARVYSLDHGEEGKVGLTPRGNGMIVPLEVGERKYFCKANSFIGAVDTVKHSLSLDRRGHLGLLDDVFVMQELTGEGVALVSVDGEVVVSELAEGESIYVDPTYLEVIEATVQVDKAKVSGVGTNLVKVTGKGRIWLKTIA